MIDPNIEILSQSLSIRRSAVDAGWYSSPASLFGSKKWSDSPYINHFLSADTIVSDPKNPQQLNRYSYVTNNPLRYTDLTGHRACGDDEAVDCDTGLVNNPSNNTNKGCGGPDKPCVGKTKNKDHKKTDTTKDKLLDFLHGTANFTQDLSLLIDTPFAITEMIFIAGECTAGPEGCVTGAFMGEAAFMGTGAGEAEAALGFISFVATVAADGLDDGQFGEDTATSFATMAVGATLWDPIGDLIVDAYGSGYNHGSFNGIITLVSTGVLLKK